MSKREITSYYSSRFETRSPDTRPAPWARRILAELADGDRLFAEDVEKWPREIRRAVDDGLRARRLRIDKNFRVVRR